MTSTVFALGPPPVVGEVLPFHAFIAKDRANGGELLLISAGPAGQTLPVVSITALDSLGSPLGEISAVSVQLIPASVFSAGRGSIAITSHINAGPYVAAIPLDGLPVGSTYEVSTSAPVQSSLVSADIPPIAEVIEELLAFEAPEGCYSETAPWAGSGTEENGPASASVSASTGTGNVESGFIHDDWGSALAWVRGGAVSISEDAWVTVQYSIGAGLLNADAGFWGGSGSQTLGSSGSSASVYGLVLRYLGDYEWAAAQDVASTGAHYSHGSESDPPPRSGAWAGSSRFRMDEDGTYWAYLAGSASASADTDAWASGEASDIAFTEVLWCA